MGHRRAATCSIAVVLVLLILPSVAAQQTYRGPGQNGFVPIGLGEQALSLPEPLVHNRSVIVLEPIPAAVCRIVLDDESTYGLAQLDWAPSSDGNNTTASIYAPLGERDVRWRIASHWLKDVKDDCTVEVTRHGVTYHDPRGRPFIELTLVENRPFYTTETNSTVRVEVVVHNNGTIADTVDARVRLQQTGWTISNGTAVTGRHVGPLDNMTIAFDLHVPANAFPRVNVFNVEFAGRESGWRSAASVFVDVKPADAPDPVDYDDWFVPLPTRSANETAAAAAVEESAGPVPLVGLGLLLVAVALQRRRA